LRIRPFLAAVALLRAASPAAADTVARFSQLDGQPPIVIELADNGDSRMTVTDAAYVTRDGTTYLVLSDSGGRFSVTLPDYLALLAELSRAAPSAGGRMPDRVEITQAGTETVAGHSGTVHRLIGPGDAAPFEIVVSDDAVLRPVSLILTNLIATFIAQVEGQNPALAARIAEVLRLGAVIRFGPIYRLESVAATPVPRSAFDVPEPPLSRDAFRERILRAATPVAN